VAVAEGTAGAAAPPAGAVEGTFRPSAKVKFFYSIGQVVESGYLIVNTFVFFYYTAVLGLSGSMVGLAVAISLTLDAIADPLIGSWSDSIRSKFGRRLPLMLIGAPLTFLTMGLLFAPPSGFSPFMLFVWLTVMKMTLRAFASVYNIPFFALGGELADGYSERAKIVGYRLLGGVVATVAITALAYSVFFAGEGGLQNPDRYPAFGWVMGALIMVVGLIACAGIWRYAAALQQPTERPRPMMQRLPGELAEVFRNPSFRILFFSMVLFTSGAGVHAALNNHNYVFVWKLKPEWIQFILYAQLAAIAVGVPLTPYLLKFLEKKVVCLIGFGLVILAWTILPVIRAAGLFAPTGAEALLWLIITTVFVGLGSGLIFVALPSMMSDAADDHEHRFGSRREGLYFSGLGFAGKAAGGVGNLVGGVTLDILRFPREMGRQVNAVIPEDVLAGLVIAWGPFCAGITFLGALIFAPYAINRSRHDAIMQELRRRRGAAST
jgi:GPH family glycoside/pentoside/hexuronide:cation symporter